MKKAVLFATIALVMGAWTFGCTTIVVKEDKGAEVLLPAEFIEGVDADTVSLRCEGIGGDQPGAILQARKGCIDWYITNKLAPTASGRKSYEAVQSDIFRKLDRYVGMPPPGARDGKGPGVKSQIRVSEEKIRVAIIVHVQKKTLEADLVSMGVMQDTADLMDSVGMPSLVAVPSKASKANKLQGDMEIVVQDYLSSNNLEVKDYKGIKDMEKTLEALGEVSGAEENEAAQIALAAGADVYFVYNATRSLEGDSVAFGVSIKAYETPTSTILGAKDSVAPARHKKTAGQEIKALKEPMNDAMSKLVPRIMEYWKRTAPKGRRYLIQFNGGPGSATKVAVNSILKRNCSRVKMLHFDPKMVRFEAQCKMDNIELSSAFEEALSAKLDGTKLNWVSLTGTMLLGNLQ